MILSSTQAPRRTGDVRSGYDVLHQHRALAEQAETVLVGQCHPSELRAGDARHPVMARDAIVQIGLVRRQQFDERTVLEQNAAG